MTLPTDLMETVCTLAPPQRQSQFIAEAIRYFVTEQERKTLRERLIAGYQVNAVADHTIAAEWSPMEDETWSKYVAPYDEAEVADDVANPAR